MCPKPNIDYTLYLVTDRHHKNTYNIAKAVEQAIQGGCTLIQLREKEASALEFFQVAQKVKSITDQYQIPLIINDRVDIALAVDCAGVHVGQNDLPVRETRALIGTSKILGVSVSTPHEAFKAQHDGADYLGVGAMYYTGTKTDAKIVTLPVLAEIRKTVSLPIVVIGGINLETAADFDSIDIDGLAVVSAILSAADIKNAAAEIKTRFLKERIRT